VADGDVLARSPGLWSGAAFAREAGGRGPAGADAGADGVTNKLRYFLLTHSINCVIFYEPPLTTIFFAKFRKPVYAAHMTWPETTRGDGTPVRWHLPTMLLWIAHHPEETHTPSGFRVSQVLQAAADIISGPTLQ
jgi:hypothetical protein